MTTWTRKLEQLPKWLVAAVSIVIVLAVGVVDYETGYETFFFTFYLLGVFLAVWFVGVWFGVLTSALSVLAWTFSNIAAGIHYSAWFVPVWNALILFSFYLVVVLLAGQREKYMNELETQVQLRTEALTTEIRERVQLQEKLLETSERVQRRIGHELHDSLCQHLTGTALTGQHISQKLAQKSLPEATEMNRLVALIQEAIDLTRSMSRGLSPMQIETGELVNYFQELADRASKYFNIECRFEGGEDARLQDPDAMMHLYRIAQEAITNAARHGKAKHVNLCLDAADDEIELTVTDDGDGLPDNARNSKGMGLRIMAYRANAIGATFNVERLPSRGTRVTCILPLIAVANTNHDTKN